MEKQIKINKEFASLEALEAYVKKESNYTTKIDWDGWEQRTDANGQLEKCLIIKKSNMNGVKLFFAQEGIIKVTHIIPNKLMNAYFGVNQQKYQSIFEIVTDKIRGMLLSSSQQKAFEEICSVFDKIKA